MAAAGAPSATPTPRDPRSELYVPLEAVDCLHRQQRTPELIQEILRFAKPPAVFLRRLEERALVLFRPVATPNFEALRFLELARLAGRRPVFLELTQDWFTPTVNPAKRRLGKLAIGRLPADQAGRTATITVTSFNETGQRRFQDVRCCDGTPFVSFHHGMLRHVAGREVDGWIVEAAEFVGSDPPRLHYERAFALYSCVGALAETFAFSGPEAKFTETVVLPAWEAVRARFGVRPAIVQLLPVGGEHDPAWDAYPPAVWPLARRVAGR